MSIVISVLIKNQVLHSADYYEFDVYIVISDHFAVAQDLAAKYKFLVNMPMIHLPQWMKMEIMLFFSMIKMYRRRWKRSTKYANRR